MSLKAVFLDLGGTLLDTESDRKAHLEMMRSFRDTVGLEASPEDLIEKYDALNEERARLLGTRWERGREFIERAVTSLLGEEGIPLTPAYMRSFLDTYWREHIRWIRMYPDTEEVLRELHRTPLHTGLISDVDEDFLQLCLYRFPLESYLDSITTSEEVGVAKPHRDIFRIALSKAGCKPQEAVHVGDSLERDIVGANGAGMRSILVSPSGEGRIADHVVSDIKGAFQVLGRLMEEATP